LSFFATAVAADVALPTSPVPAAFCDGMSHSRWIARPLPLVIPGRAVARARKSIIPEPAMAYQVYLLASKKHGTLYLGVTNDIVRRGHRTSATQGFAKRYGVDRLVWFEIYDDAMTAIAREKELKKWRY